MRGRATERYIDREKEKATCVMLEMHFDTRVL